MAERRRAVLTHMAHFTAHLSVQSWQSGELSVLEYFYLIFFSKKLQASVILAYISSFVMSLRCVVCPRYLNSATFFNFFG